MIGLLKQLSVAALYVLLSFIVHHHFESSRVIRVFDPASGLALAALLIGGKRYFWGVFLGAFLYSAMDSTTPIPAIAIATGSAMEAFIGAWLLTRNNRFDPSLQSLRGYLLLILIGSICSIIGALSGTTTLLFSGQLTSGTYLINSAHLWMGDALGIALITPLILVYWQTKNDWIGAKRVAEAALLLGLTFLAGQIIFLGWFNTTDGSFGQIAMGYWMFLFITWITVRLGSRGTVIAVNIVAVQALLGAYYGVGFFANDFSKTQLTNYWFYVLALSIVGMALATFLTERKSTEQKLRDLSSHLLTVREEEKAHIAREIHDDLGGTLTALRMETYLMAEELSANKGPMPLIEHIESIGKLIDNTKITIRRIITGLRPAILDDLGLQAAIEWYAIEFHKHTGIECQVDCMLDKENEKKLSEKQQINLFRIFQEILTNVAKHSHASRVAIEMYCSDGEITLSISDNGRGILKNHVVAPSSYGMLGMRERAAQIGGTIKFGNLPGGGFNVTGNFPLANNV